MGPVRAGQQPFPMGTYNLKAPSFKQTDVPEKFFKRRTIPPAQVVCFFHGIKRENVGK
ncbi:MAG: hypothetical protein MR704_10870 [Clostridia bacterium]|nr:hypothetical protein [Clostridia bacterium]